MVRPRGGPHLAALLAVWYGCHTSRTSRSRRTTLTLTLTLTQVRLPHLEDEPQPEEDHGDAMELDES